MISDLIQPYRTFDANESFKLPTRMRDVLQRFNVSRHYSLHNIRRALHMLI